MKYALNPYMPSWEYIPDGEPHVFGDRVYVYGSHDAFAGQTYCVNDYICYSAPVEDLSAWRYEGVIFRKRQDPVNPDGHMILFAPDVTQGPDGRYYLYYVLNKVGFVSVAVCDTPAGKYEFYGYVHYPDGTRLGEREGDEPQFDPAVLTEGNRTYLYTGFAWASDKSRSGARMAVLDADMLTVIEDPVTVVPSGSYSAGTGFEGHEFFEGSSIRKVGEKYYFVYSSVQMYELCYAVSDRPGGGFVYGGVLISNNDCGIDSYKPADKPMYYGGNNHGGMVKVKDQWYIFYHRHTNATNYSRQGMAEKIFIREDGSIAQAEMTSCGLNDGPLPGSGVYPAYCACSLFCSQDSVYTGGMGGNGFWLNTQFPRILQDAQDGCYVDTPAWSAPSAAESASGTPAGAADSRAIIPRDDGLEYTSVCCDEEGRPLQYIMNITDSATCGFKYFDCRGVKEISITVRGYADGCFEVKTAWDGEVLGEIPVIYSDVWKEYRAKIALPDGVQAIWFTYRGKGCAALKEFGLYH